MSYLPKPDRLTGLRVLAVLLVLGAVHGRPCAADVIINEVLAKPDQDWDGNGTLDFKGDEWIEVLNNGTAVEDLSLYYLRDIAGADAHLQLDGLLPPGEVRVYFGSDAMAWQVANGLTDSGFALNNTGETVELLQLVDPEVPEVFQVVHSVTLLTHETQSDRSSGWSQESGGWVLFDALNVYSGSLAPGTSGCQPTPGDMNVCIPLVPVTAQSWDQVKSLYR